MEHLARGGRESKGFLLALLAAAIATGCGHGTTGGNPVDGAGGGTRLVFALVDGSGSYDSHDRALQQIETVARELEGGDRLVVRRIGSSSYGADAELVDVTLPGARTANPFDARSAALSRSAGAARDSVLASVSGTLERARRAERSRYTDILGALAAAEETLARSRAPTRLLLIASDLDDNVASGRVHLDLGGVTVRFFAFEYDGSLSEARRRQEQWRRRMEDMGALDVAFVPPSDAPTIKSDPAQATRGSRR